MANDKQTNEAGTEPQQQQQQQQRFSFYDAEEVGGILAASRSESSPLAIEEEPSNPNRFRFYDPKLIAEADEHEQENESSNDNDEEAEDKNDNENDNENDKETKTNTELEITPLQQLGEEESSEAKQQPPHDNYSDSDEDEDKDDSILAETTHPESIDDDDEDDDDDEGDNDVGNTSDANTDEILRSLQETEVQRNQILQPPTPSQSSSSLQLPLQLQAQSQAPTMTGVDLSASAGVISPETLGANHNYNPNDNYGTNNNNNYGINHNHNHSSHNQNQNQNQNHNPYEDSLRTALDLLRKHKRSLPGSPTERPRTPRDQDKLLQHRSYDENEGLGLDHVVQEAKLKSKQHKEAIARYANKLEEFKSTLSPEEQFRISASHTQSYDEGDHHHHHHHNGSDHNQNGETYRQTGAETEDDRNRSQSQSQQQQPPNHIHRHIRPSLTEDSTGLVSELSHGSHYNLPRSHHSATHPEQQAIIEEQVQKGVEKVLVAILEASKHRSGDSVSLASAAATEHNSIRSGGNSRANSNANANASNSNSANDALLRVLHELLPSSRSVDAGSVDDGRATIASGVSRGSSGTIKHKSSVVDELLAEDDDDDVDGHDRGVCGTISLPKHHLPSERSGSASANPPAQTPNTNAARYWGEDDEKKMMEDHHRVGYSGEEEGEEDNDDDDDDDGGIEVDPILSPTYRGGRTVAGNNPQLTIRTSNLDVDNRNNAHDDDGVDDTLYESETSRDDDDDSGDDEDEDDEMDTTYEDQNDSYEDDDEESEHHVGVLGPLSREAGGTTGVVLDLESDESPPREKAGFFSSVVNHYASGAASSFAPLDNAEQPQILDHKRKEEILAHYDVVGTTTNIHDEEATELMRTLCAHLLPFGVDQNSGGGREESSIPVWDEDNPNEPGYRIIRLSKTQLRRVECAFDAMITRLKHNLLNDVDEPLDDANFIRELEEAERLLDDEEKRNAVDATVGNEAAQVATKSRPLPVAETPQEERAKGAPHPEFPGVKSAGNGEMGDLEYFQLPIIYKSHVTGFEPTKDIKLEPGNIIAGQYLVEGKLGSAAFSTAYKCVDYSSPSGREEVCLKVIKNTKDFFDQSLDEIKILELLRQTGQCDENHILRVKTFFYYREHLIIVTELLRQNLFEFGKFIVDNDEEPYFTLPRLAYITRQCLIALRFVHNLGLVHSDVKPENILLGSYSRAQIKLIDFGSSCYLTDRQSSYIQSRSYRAPEVVLGLPYDGKIDVWSLGCVVAEMYTGEVTFQNDSIVSMLSRIEAYRGSFPRHMIAQGRQSTRFFTKSGLLYEVVGDSEDEDEAMPNNRIAPAPDDEESDNDSEAEEMEFDVFQPKSTRLSSRLGFDEDLMDDYGDRNTSVRRQIEQMFTDFVARLLTIDPDGRPTADEALNHPYMLYAASLTDDQIKYPSS